MAENILTTPSSGEVTLGDGQVYKLSAMDLTTMAELEEAFDCTLSKMLSKFEEREATNTRLFLFILLKENHPKLTLKSLGRLMPPNIMSDIMETLKLILLTMEK